jgi:tRNA(fMet)-specific endonuclease VapC
MARYMLDTNICIYLMKHHPPEVAQRFAQCFVGDVVISAITLAELEYGVAASDEANRQRNQAALEAFLSEVPAAPFDAQAAKAYGPVRMLTRERKRDALDKLIASHAMALDVTLVTNNPADFVVYDKLRLENWVAGH